MSQTIAVDIGGTHIRVAAYNSESTSPIAHHRTRSYANEPGVYDRLVQAIDKICSPEVTAIGIASPGPLDPYTGTILATPNIPEWQNFPLAPNLSKHFGVPVHLDNDANMAGLAEWKFGAGKGHHDLVYLTISTGIGGGVIAGGRLLLGARGLAAEVGHILVVPDGPLCGCGQRGHLEAVASGTAIGRTARARLKAGDGADSKIWELAGGEIEAVTAAMVGQAAQAGDDFALQLMTEAGTFIGRTLASLLHLFNPSVVILGGGVSLEGDVLLEPVRAAVRRYSMGEMYWQKCQIVAAALGDDAGLVGAGALAMESVSST